MRAALLCVALAAVVGCGASKQATPMMTVQAAGRAESLQAAFERVVRAVSPQVVQISQPAGLGSGIVFDNKGDIVTNAHVVDTAKNVVVTVSTGKTYRAKVVGTFVPDDLALVRVTAGNLPPPATFADSSKLAVGEIVLAIGNPLGLTSSVTEGIISALGRTQTEETGATLANTVQTSAAINPGNSGGALVDLNGRVVGMNTLAAGSPAGGLAPGIGFAIPSNTIKDIGGQIATHGKVISSHRPFIGISAATLPTGGILVTKVYAGSGAARAGLRAGDVIVAIDGTPTPTLDALAQALASHKPGDQVKVELSGRRKATLNVTLGELPAP
ncbi:MAG: S1C family serine protease [Gaiellaceae bacterium]